RRHRCIGEEGGAVGVEAEQEDGRSQRIGLRLAQREGQWEGAVEGEVAHDVEKAAAVGSAARAGDRAVEAVREPAGEKEHGGEKIEPQDHRSRAAEPCGEARQRHGIGRDAGRGQPAARDGERRVDDTAHDPVEHVLRPPGRAGQLTLGPVSAYHAGGDVVRSRRSRSCEMYRAETRGIRVTVEPRFLEEESSPREGRFFWAYTVEIVNLSAETVQLKARHWTITDGEGRSQEVHGPGVVGEEPILEPGESFTYTSGCP